MNADIANQEQASFDKLVKAFSVFDDAIAAFMSYVMSLGGAPPKDQLQEGIKRCEDFQGVLNSFATDAQRFQQAGLQRIADYLASYRNTVEDTTRRLRETMAQQGAPATPWPGYQPTSAIGGGLRKCPPADIMRKMNAFRGLLDLGYPREAAQVWVDFMFGV